MMLCLVPIKGSNLKKKTGCFMFLYIHKYLGNTNWFALVLTNSTVACRRCSMSVGISFTCGPGILILGAACTYEQMIKK